MTKPGGAHLPRAWSDGIFHVNIEAHGDKGLSKRLFQTSSWLSFNLLKCLPRLRRLQQNPFKLEKKDPR